MATREEESGNNSPEQNTDVDAQNKGVDENQDSQVDSLLDSLEDDSVDDVVGKEKEGSGEEEGKKNASDFYKKIGNHEFTSEEDYDKFVKKNYGEVSRLFGEKKKLEQQVQQLQGNSQQGQEEENPEDQGNKKLDQPDDETLYWRFKTQEFYKENPTARDYKDLMGTILRSGRANIGGEPDLDLAFAKALRSDGQKVPDSLANRLRTKTGKDDGSEEVKKRVMKSGGGSEGEEDSIKSLSEFADKTLLGF